MKKFLLSILCLVMFVSLGYCTTLDGGVKFNVQSAREYVFDGVPKFKLDAQTPYYFKKGSNIDKVIYTYNNYNQIIGITVRYKHIPDKAYIYDEDKSLIYVDIYDKDTNLYPHRGYRYNLQGKLILTSLSITKDEHYRFDYMGNLLAHSKNGIIYDENGRQIGKAR
ncbi:MAG: hypothetical protein DKM22_05535 [Candidatus Melainabacteria bacterium]|nr:MAG: hypothetical protein DKM22_05535 [Candidatus Melainabacteria bacterium]